MLDENKENEASLAGENEAAEPRAFRLWILLLALAAAGAGAFLAPQAWPSGEGQVLVEFEGRPLIRSSMEVGSSEPRLLRAQEGDLEIEVDFPDGVPADSEIKALARVRRNGVLVRPELSALEITLQLPDGRSESVPSVRFNDESLTLEAKRRPPVNAAVVLALLGAVVVLWISELFPLFVTSLLIPVVLVFMGVSKGPSALQPFFSPIIVLFFAGFLMAEALRRTGLDRLAAAAIVAKTAKSPKTLFAALLCTSAILSMWMSNTAAVALLTPIAISITEPMRHLGYRKAVVLGIAYAGTLGGVGSAIGTPANQLAIELLGTFDVRSISFVEWFAFGLPVVALLLPVIGFYLWNRMGVRVDAETFQHARARARKELEETGRLTRAQLIVLVVFAAVVGGWLTQTMHGIHPGMVALAGTVLLAALSKIKAPDLKRISWASLLTFGGGLTIGLFLVQTGTSDWVATRLGSLSGAPSMLAIFAMAGIALVLTSVASNTASAAILIPIAIPLSSVIGVDPTLLVVIVAVASSLDFALVIGTPPTMIAYSTGLYTPAGIFRIGIVLDLVALVVLAGVVVWLWQFMGVV